MKYRVTGLVFCIAWSGACSHSELKKMLHPDPERRVRITTQSPTAALEKLRKLEEFETVGAGVSCDSEVMGNASKPMHAMCVTESWPALRTPPMLGRAFLSTDPAGQRAAILSYEAWQKRYAGDPRIIGQTLESESKKITIVGVLPEGAAQKEDRTVDVYLSWSPSGDTFTLAGLLRRGVSLKQAQVAADAAGAKAKLDLVTLAE